MPPSAPDPVLATSVRQLREDKGLTREALALRTGLAVSTIAHTELARSVPNWMTLRRIAAGLDLSIARLAAAVEAAERTPTHAI
jgi:transcriptional regulator with XRE-family HTH domain